MNKIVIADASCLIAIDKINKLALLNQLFKQTLVTPEVQLEFGAQLPKWIKIRSVKSNLQHQKLQEQLDEGEASAIILALELENASLIIDEKKGRKVAQKLGLKIIGTLKLLVLFKQAQLIPEVKPVLQQLTNCGFRFSQQIADQLLKEANELS